MRTHRARVVVGMPVYNSASWLKSTLAAWLEQTWTDFRLVISDNASTDASYEICQEFARTDGRLEVHRNPRNLGIHGNFRRVFELGKDCDYFMWASSHDFFAPTTLEQCVSALESDPGAVLCSGRARLFEGDVSHATDYLDIPLLDSESPLVRLRAITASLRRNNLIHGVMRTSALVRTRGLEDYFSADNVLVAHLALMGRIIQLPDVLFYRRIDREASTQRMSDSEKRKHWDPTGSGMTDYTHWKIDRGMFRAVLATQLPPPEKIAALLFVMRFAYWDRRNLVSDLVERMRALVKKPDEGHA